MTELYTNVVEGNTIKFEFNIPDIEDGNISENFDFKGKSFTCTNGVYEIIDLSEFKKLSSDLIFDLVKSSLKNNVLKNIITTLYGEAKKRKLDYLQKIYINGTLCWLIDNGNDICLLLPSEY